MTSNGQSLVLKVFSNVVDISAHRFDVFAYTLDRARANSDCSNEDKGRAQFSHFLGEILCIKLRL